MGIPEAMVIPFAPGMVLADINAGLLFVMAITSVGVYGVIIAGWASNSKYSFLGAMRASGWSLCWRWQVCSSRARR